MESTAVGEEIRMEWSLLLSGMGEWCGVSSVGTRKRAGGRGKEKGRGGGSQRRKMEVDR